MGDFRVVVEAMGSHGCERGYGNGAYVVGCERPGCTDCITREYVRRLKRAGATVHMAELVHWPADMKDRGYEKDKEVRDNLLTGIRIGNFPELERYGKG